MSQPLANSASSGNAASSNMSTVFKDVHSSLAQLTSEIEYIQKTITQNDESLSQEIEEISRDIENESFERKDSFHRLRHEFEVFAHRKAEKVVQELEELSKAEGLKDRARMRQLTDLTHDMDRLKTHIASIGLTWGRLVASISDPQQRHRLPALPSTDVMNTSGAEDV